MNDEIIEYWREIPGWEKYYCVSNLGRLASLRSSRGLRFLPRICSQKKHLGYLRARLSRNNKITWEFVHRLIVMTFIGQIGKNLQVRHLDGNKSNNMLSNLAIGTAKENGEDSVRLGVQPFGSSHGMATLKEDDVKKIRARAAVGESQKMIATDFNIHPSTVYKIIRRKLWNHV